MTEFQLPPLDLQLTPTHPYFGGSGPLDPALRGRGTIDPSLLDAATRSAQGRQGQPKMSPLEMLRASRGMGASPRAEAASQLIGGGGGGIGFAPAQSGPFPPWLLQLVETGAKIAPFV